MGEHLNARTLRGFYCCFEQDNFAEHVRAYLATDVVWHVAGENPLAGRFSGQAAVIEQMLRYQAHSRGTLRLDTSIMASDSHAVAIHVATATVPGFAYTAHEVDVFHIQNELIAEFWSFSEDQAATDRIWS